MNKCKLLGISILALAGLSGCTAVGMATGAGTTVGVAAAQEGGLNRAGKDFIIQAEINELWFQYDVDMFTKLDLTVNQGRVLITGVVQNPEHRVEAVRLAWQPDGVEEVINEITVADSQGFIGFARDTWISGRLRTAITFDGDVQSINYNIDTVQGVVYLMGFAQSQAELNRVTELARTIPDVKRVVSYVKIVGEEEQAVGSPTSDASPSASYVESTPMPSQQELQNEYSSGYEQSAPTSLRPNDMDPSYGSGVIESEDLLPPSNQSGY